MVGVSRSKEDHPEASEWLLNQFYNFGFFVSDEYYDGYAVVKNMEKLLDFLKWKAETDTRLAGWTVDFLGEEGFQGAVDDLYDILTSEIKFVPPITPRNGVEYRVSRESYQTSHSYD
jgi:hypothetical protein